MKALWLLTVVVMLAVAGCALRPRYVSLTGGAPVPSTVSLQVLDSTSGQPVPGTIIELGDRNRYRTVADVNGMFVLPVEAKYVDENALVVVTLPRGVYGYKLVNASAPAASNSGVQAPVEPSGDDAGISTY